MIVKNEARVIARCLASVRDYLSHWVIVDTGSTDGTQELVRDILGDIPGTLYERPWVDFGHNRSEAMDLAREAGAEWILLLDADETLEGEVPERLPDVDRIMVFAAMGTVAFSDTILVRSKVAWRFEGVTHEYLTAAEESGREILDGVTLREHADSHRRVEQRKYLEDVELLEAAVKADPDNSRSWFYLAQSYRDFGNLGKAIESYARRAAMGGWEEEVFYSLLQIAVLSDRDKRPWAEVQDAYLQAYQYRPSRIDPLCELARACREREEYALAYVFAKHAVEVPPTRDELFVDRSYHDWRAADECSIAAYYVGDIASATRLGSQLLSNDKLPHSERARVAANLDFAQRLQTSDSAEKA